MCRGVLRDARVDVANLGRCRARAGLRKRRIDERLQRGRELGPHGVVCVAVCIAGAGACSSVARSMRRRRLGHLDVGEGDRCERLAFLFVSRGPAQSRQSSSFSVAPSLSSMRARSWVCQDGSRTGAAAAATSVALRAGRRSILEAGPMTTSCRHWSTLGPRIRGQRDEFRIRKEDLNKYMTNRFRDLFFYFVFPRILKPPRGCVGPSHK